MRRTSPLVLSSLLVVTACGNPSPPTPLAEKKEEIATVAKKTTESVTFVVDGSNAKVVFAMQAPLEKQDGEVPAAAVSGEIHVDPTDLGCAKRSAQPQSPRRLTTTL